MSFFESSVHEEALARLYFVVEQHRRCGILAGPGGTGKSLLLQILQQQVRRTQRKLVLVDLTARSGYELLCELCSGLGRGRPDEAPLTALWRRLEDTLRCWGRSRIQTVVVLDHCERAQASCWPILQRLVQIDRNPVPAVSVVATVQSQPPHAEKSETSNLVLDPRRQVVKIPDAFLDLADLQIPLRPFRAAESAQYVDFLMRRAGADDMRLTSSGLAELHLTASGIPRQINRTCELALLDATQRGARHIDAQDVRRAVLEFPLTSGLRAAS